jgi:hypothetical protein
MRKWDEKLWLFTIEEFNQLPDGIGLKCIDGEIVIKGKDYIDLDTRFNHIAYGVTDPWNHKEKHLFLMFGLCQE